MCLNINREVLCTDDWKIKNKVNRLAGKSWLLLEKDSGEEELRDLEVTTSPWCEFTTPTMKVKKTVPASKKNGRRCLRKESSSPQTDRVVAEGQSCPSVPGCWQQCTSYNYFLYLLWKNKQCICLWTSLFTLKEYMFMKPVSWVTLANWLQSGRNLKISPIVKQLCLLERFYGPIHTIILCVK